MTLLYRRIALPKGWFAASYDADEQQASRVKTLVLGSIFPSESDTPSVVTNWRLAFELEVPERSVRAEGIVRNMGPGEGTGVEFTKMGPRPSVGAQQKQAMSWPKLSRNVTKCNSRESQVL